MSDLHGGPWWTHHMKDVSGGKSMGAGAWIVALFIAGVTLAVEHGIKKLYKTITAEPEKK